MYGCNMPQAGPLPQLLLHFQLEQMSPISRAQILSSHTHSPISTMTPAQHRLYRRELTSEQWNTRITCSAAESSVGSGMTDRPPPPFFIHQPRVDWRHRQRRFYQCPIISINAAAMLLFSIRSELISTVLCFYLLMGSLTSRMKKLQIHGFVSSQSFIYQIISFR